MVECTSAVDRSGRGPSSEIWSCSWSGRLRGHGCGHDGLENQAESALVPDVVFDMQRLVDKAD